MSARTLPSLLSLPELINAKNTDTDVRGTGVEAEADQLFISNRFSEAAEAYRALDLDDINRREKLAYCLFCAGQKDFYTVLDARIEHATPWGLALHSWAFNDRRFAFDLPVDDLAERLTRLLQCAVKMDSWPKLREYLIAGCWHHSLQQRHDTPAMRTLQSTASAALGKTGSKLQETLELCTRIFNYYRDRTEPQVRALDELVASTSTNDTPVLSALFSAAMIVQNTQQAKSALSELCRRYSDHQYLEQTVSAVAVEAGCPEFLDCLPAELKAASLNRPEICLIVAMVKQDPSEVHALAETMPASGPADSVIHLPRIAEPFFDFLLSGRTSQVGGWGGSVPWEAILGERLVKTLPAGALRNSFLRTCREFLSDEEFLVHTKDLCDLFESSLSDEDFYSILRPECLQLVNAHSVAKYLIRKASEESEYSPFECDEEEIPWDRFVPAIKEELASLQTKVGAAVESVLDGWGVPLRPTLERRLAGEGLPVFISTPLASIEDAISELNGSDLAYLQLALLKLSTRVAERISPAATHEVAIHTYNDFIRPSSLTEYGEGRVRALANRYGAARFLQGLDALMRSPEFNPKTDRELSALSKILVTLQGSLQVRRAYLAGVLRKRLKNLKSHWLDQQVSEAMTRGVDIEQMIDLAKGVSSWDDWTDGLSRLAPY
ncbi:hypothetical protein [Pseudomonas sp. MWU12-2037]|uniref:hypothetical protein n=1 Tax=Pseudomonas sp. MWU12-2037 TaxID=2928690 RepID=UPI00200D41CA|nr:hypothetical protein [Pseudomonas sp. MWU12-2037]